MSLIFSTSIWSTVLVWLSVAFWISSRRSVLLELVVEILADVAQGNLSVLGILLALLDQLLATVLAGGRELEHDHPAVDDRVAAEVGLVDAADDVLRGRGIEGLDAEVGGRGDCDAGDMLEGHVGVIDVDHDLVQKSRRHPSRAQRGEGILEGLDGLVHLFDAFIQNIHREVLLKFFYSTRKAKERKRYLVIRVPIFSPFRSRTALWGSAMLKTRIWMSVSSKRPTAVLSIT